MRVPGLWLSIAASVRCTAVEQHVGFRRGLDASLLLLCCGCFVHYRMDGLQVMRVRRCAVMYCLVCNVLRASATGCHGPVPEPWAMSIPA